jgi:hypothetical protein
MRVNARIFGEPSTHAVTLDQKPTQLKYCSWFVDADLDVPLESLS